MVDGIRERFAAWRRRMALSQAYRTVFATPEGEMVLRDLLREARVLESAYAPGDAHGTHWNDGRRSMGLYLLDRLRWSQGELVKLAQETTTARLAGAAEDEEAA